MKFIFVGDIVGKGGRQTVIKKVPEIMKEHGCSFCIINGENAANGAGINEKCVKQISEVADVITTGDHVWDQKSFQNEIAGINNILRPANLHKSQPGKGWNIFRNSLCGDIAVINLQGKVFLRDSAYCPFETAENILREIPKNIKTIVLDFHSEATSEAIAMGYFLDGRVTAVLGTHTHVQTADAKILPKGTAYITDVGMTGADYSVLGRKVEPVLYKFTSGMPCRLPVEKNNIRMDCVIVEYNTDSIQAKSIDTISVHQT